MENAIKERISTTKNLVLKYALKIGYYSMYDSQVHFEKGFSLENKDFCQKFLQAEIERRRQHLEETIDVFGNKMNKLDPSINFSRGDMVPFEYEAELYVTFTMPKMPGQDTILGMSSDLLRAYEKRKKEEQEQILKWKEFAKSHGGLYNVKNRALFNDIIPGQPQEKVKIGSVKVIGYKCTASFERPGFQIEGMEFIGKVKPYVNSDDLSQQYAQVDLVDEYAHDVNLTEYLKKTSAQIKCDFCKRKSSRDIYFIFKDREDNLHYYGRNCAEKAFGVDIIEKLDRFMRGLFLLGEEFAKHFKGGNVFDDEITAEILSMMQLGMLYNKVDYKAVLNYKGYYVSILERLKENPDIDEKEIPSSQTEAYKFLKANLDEAEKLTAMYMTYGPEFYTNYSVSNDFSEKLKAFSLALLLGNETAFRKLPGWILPFSLNNFFRFFKLENNKEEQNIDSTEEQIMPYPMFDSYKRFECEIVEKRESKTKYGSPYLIYNAYAIENGIKYGIMWCDFKMNGQMFEIGDKVIVQGSYSKFNKAGSKFTNLDNVTVAPAEASDTQTSSVENMEKYAVGNRLRNETVVVSKVTPKYIIVETQDGVKFLVYISTYEERTGREVQKFNIEFAEGQNLRITGTVQKSGKGYLFLNRCKIEGLNESINHNLMQFDKTDIKEMVYMALQQLLI